VALRVLLADDHPVVRRGLAALLASFPDIEVVGEAATGAEAIAATSSLEPEVVVMDLHMPDTNGIDATRQILQAAPGVGVVVLTMFDDDDSVFAAMRAGARGYLLKDADQHEVVRAIRAVASDEAIFSPTIARRLIGYFAAMPANLPTIVFPELTERERQVLELIAAGHSNSQIAQRLVLSPKTVRNRVSSIFSKLQVADRAQAIVRAREAGLGHEPTSPR
jgi:DNA-binding NarL/FixJ family response regulator